MSCCSRKETIEGLDVTSEDAAGMLGGLRGSAGISRRRSGVLHGFRDRIATRVHADIGDQLASLDGPTAPQHATALTAMAFGMMERDVRTYVRNSRAVRTLKNALVFSYLR
ncbi:MAG: hypothetical protein JO168_17020 [Solirubrobacterales bacterium]|nr:hypothetical protein [Solirubrobacterales bacterium]